MKQNLNSMSSCVSLSNVCLDGHDTNSVLNSANYRRSFLSFDNVLHAIYFRVLTWEDGYFDHSKARRNIENCLDELYFNRSGKLCSFVDENGIQNESASQFPLGFMEADMLCLHYSLGEG